MTLYQTPLPFLHPLLQALWDRISTVFQAPSVVHGADHVYRVAAVADRIAIVEGANRLIVGAAALLHDICRNDSDLVGCHALAAAEKARVLLAELAFAQDQIECVVCAIEAHRFSSGPEAPSLEAQVLQDADRLDAIGAIGMLRAFAFGDELTHSAYHPSDPFHRTERPLDDMRYAIDHFYRKLLQIIDTLHTVEGRRIARRRQEFMEAYLDALEHDLADAQLADTQVADTQVADVRELVGLGG